MSHLIEENREAKEEIERLRKANIELSDELLAFKTYVSADKAHSTCMNEVSFFTRILFFFPSSIAQLTHATLIHLSLQIWLAYVLSKISQVWCS